MTEEQVRAKATPEELPILAILLKTGSAIITNKQKLELAKEIAKLANHCKHGKPYVCLMCVENPLDKGDK